MKPKPLVELNHLTVPVVMMNPFIAIEKPQHSCAADDDSDFERKGSFRTRCQTRDKQS